MQFILSIFSAAFIALLLATALFFSFALLIWVIAIAVGLTISMYVNRLWRRWRFVHSNPMPRQPVHVIEGEFRDITDSVKR